MKKIWEPFSLSIILTNLISKQYTELLEIYLLLHIQIPSDCLHTSCIGVLWGFSTCAVAPATAALEYPYSTLKGTIRVLYICSGTCHSSIRVTS